jgi:hypothetical protein
MQEHTGCLLSGFSGLSLLRPDELAKLQKYIASYLEKQVGSEG